VIIPAQVVRDHGYAAQFDMEAYEHVGCVRCDRMGYRGRIGLFEVMTMSDAIRKLALERAPADQITAVALHEGMRRLRDDGLDKVKAGLTSMAEIARVTGSA
jgi:type IV pilus assembly protein PilB